MKPSNPDRILRQNPFSAWGTNTSCHINVRVLKCEQNDYFCKETVELRLRENETLSYYKGK